ncbi:MAG: DUF5675 family protein [Bacteroidaceae bacterium]|nr:DUF5675 family protein [Bacteroidaceae bacterium]
MDIIIKRYLQKTDTTNGELFIDNHHVCDTAENTHYMLEAGIYPVQLTEDPIFHRKFPHLGAGCNIRFGNGVYNLEDSTILVGTYIAPGCLCRSRIAFDTLYERIRKSAERGHQITLTIE